ncbi:MAG: 30S ribosomal protein S4 [Endomicrobium sp.]|jgi:small subunit ribosomal protein S4|nr:30S ribosomal protein S4 [Endomicrobium sp.]
MARYLGSVCKLCRREKEKLFLKGNRCFSTKCVMVKNKGKKLPGQHSMSRSKLSDYAKHLREKQKAKRFYCLTEEQFNHYYEIAEKKIGSTGLNLLKLLELRLDTVVFYLKFAVSRIMARQIINHGTVLVNNKKITMPRYQVKINDVITVSEKYKKIILSRKIDNTIGFNIPIWLSLNKDMSGKIIGEPVAKEFHYNINSQLIVEYYSK